LGEHLKIGVNFVPFSPARRGGVVYYGLNLLRELAGLRGHDVVIFLRPDAERWLRNCEWFDILSVIQVHMPHQILDYRSRFDVLLNLSYRDSVHALDLPVITCIPDINHRYYPQFWSALDLSYRNIHYPKAVYNSTLLITPSNYSKRTLVKNFQIREEKVKVVHHGLHPTFFESASRGLVNANLPIGIGSYLFYPANSWRHKNHRGLLDALLKLKVRFGVEVTLVLTGQLLHEAYNHCDIMLEARLRGLDNQVFHLGLVPITTLKQLYTSAAALIFPSLFEGFGLPLVEAMSCGCAIMASHRSSIPEIAGKAALYFNPDDPSDIAEKILHFLDAPKEAERRVQIGREKASLFRPKEMAEAHLSVFESAFRMITLDTRSDSHVPESGASCICSS
jgi:glycosyltransferase involved in cell wall biosynthesis